MSTLSVATIKSGNSGAPVFKNSSGTEKGQLVKAWVRFNGTGTVGIDDDFNVSSITDLGAGEYNIEFSNSMSNANYCAVGSCSEHADTVGNYDSVTFCNYATSSVDIWTFGSASTPGTEEDMPIVNALIIGVN